MSDSKLIVFVQHTAMGHLRSTVELAKLLAQKHQRISILVLLLELPNLKSSTVKAYIESQSHEIDPNQITFRFLPPLPDAFDITVDLQKSLVKKALEEQGTKASALVLDMLYVDIMDVANELGIPSYIYFTSGANLLSLLFHVQSLVQDEGVDVAFTNPEAKLDIPGYMNQVPAKVLPWFGAKESRWLVFILHMTKRFRESKGILLNTFMEFESSVIRAMLDRVKDKIPPIYPIGPILSLHQSSLDKSQQGCDQDQDLMKWLDAQAPSSVVFLCFGSMGKFNMDQVMEIANGLDLSGYRFLWSLPKVEGNFDEALLEGFVEGIGHRGKIIGWAPQVLILAHRAIGGFVTHCGWNSILESLWFGVPMATWPIYSEQQLNAFAMVKELRLATEISIEYRRDFKIEEGNILVTAEEIKNGVKKLMNIDEEMKERLREIKDLSRIALKDGGSSNQWLAHFLEVVSSNVKEK